MTEGCELFSLDELSQSQVFEPRSSGPRSEISWPPSHDVDFQSGKRSYLDRRSAFRRRFGVFCAHGVDLRRQERRETSRAGSGLKDRLREEERDERLVDVGLVVEAV